MKKIILFFLVFNLSSQFFSQDNSPGVISGNIQAIGQYYQEDTLIMLHFQSIFMALMDLPMLIFKKEILEQEYDTKVI